MDSENDERSFEVAIDIAVGVDIQERWEDVCGAELWLIRVDKDEDICALILCFQGNKVLESRA